MSNFENIFGKQQIPTEEVKTSVIETTVEEPNISFKNTEITNAVIHTVPAPNNAEAKNRGNGTVDVVNFKNLTQIFNKGKENEYKLFENFSLDIKDIPGDFQSVSIMGASGCGKSRLVRLLCGLDTVQSGEVKVYGKSLSEFGNIPMVFQNHSASNYPWMTIIENVMLPMIVNGVDKETARNKAIELLKLVGLEGKVNEYPNALSGGQNQRSAIARALATGNQIIVFDEATGALDIKMKREVQNIILKILYDATVDPTIINITHSIEEALYVSNRLVILSANPCTIVKTIDIHYPGEETKQRGEWIFETPEYTKYYSEVSAIMNNNA